MVRRTKATTYYFVAAVVVVGVPIVVPLSLVPSLSKMDLR